MENLLRLHEGAGSFLERPAAATGAFLAAVQAPPCEAAGMTVGPYRLVERLGEGGMGTVWLAQQCQPVKRLVALKLVKAGMDSRQVLARFEAERQALALMDHPGIARVLDGGTTAGGRPYFVMDLVKGVPITRYCDERHLTPRQRLGLFIPVCQAVQHAHHKGVIHRDIKPSNVLVAECDGAPVVKVIDFGIAKAVGEPLTDRTLDTGLGAVVGTLEYMSPEQAELNQLDVDTRSDVYSLGVLLYELLTGATPLDRRRLKGSSLLELLRLVREQDAPTLRGRLDTAEDLPALAASRGLEPASLFRQLRGELDWIVMKALAKDRDGRYATPSDLADDVRRYLADEPVLAGPPSAWYGFSKFVRRNRTPLAVAAALGLLALTAGAFAWHNARQAAERRAEAEGREREEKARLGRDEAAFAAHLTQCEDLLRADQAEQAALALGAAERRAPEGGAEELATRLARCRTDLAMLRELDAINNLQWTWIHDEYGGHAPDNEVMKARWRKVLAVYGVLPEKTPQEVASRRVDDSLVRERLLAALDFWLALQPSASERLAGSPVCRWIREVLRYADPDRYREAVRDALLAADSRAMARLAGQREALAQPPRCAAVLGLHPAISVGRRRAVLESALRARPADLALLMTLGTSYPKDKQDHVGVGERLRWFQAAVSTHPRSPAAHSNLGHVLRDKGDLDGAIAAFRAAIRLDPLDPGEHVNLAHALATKGEMEEAAAEYRRAADIDPKHVVARTMFGLHLGIRGELERGLAELREAVKLDPAFAAARIGLGSLLVKTKKTDEAIAELEVAARLAPKQAFAWHGLGHARRQKGDVDRAIADNRRALKLNPDLAPALNDLAWILAAGPDRVVDGKQALGHAARACELTRWKEPIYIATLAAAHAETGDFARAADLQERALSFAEYEKKVGESGWEVLRTFAENQRLRDAALDRREVLPPPRELREGPPDVLARIDQGRALWKQKKRPEAIAELRAAVKLDPKYVPSRTALARVLKASGKPGEAIAELRAAIGIDPKNASLRDELARALEDSEKPAEAIAEYRKAADLEPSRSRWRINLANALDDNEKPDEAIAVLREGVALNPKNASLRASLGNLLQQNGKPDEAVTELREAIRITGGDLFTNFTLGRALAARGDPDGAIAAFKTALRINRKFSPAHFFLGKALQGKQDMAGAASSYRAAIQHTSDFFIARNALAWLLAAGPDGVRDGKQAVEHATRACEQTMWGHPGFIDTLAAAHAEAGEFKKAAELQKKALSFRGFEKEHGKRARERLALYERKMPYRDPTLAYRQPAPPRREVKP